MRTMTDLDDDALAVVLNAAQRVVDLREYLPRGGLLLMLVTKFRDDIREDLEMEALGLPQRTPVSVLQSLDSLTTSELDSLWGAVVILQQPRFTRVMSDPALPVQLDQLRAMLHVQKAERRQLRAEVRS